MRGDGRVWTRVEVAVQTVLSLSEGCSSELEECEEQMRKQSSSRAGPFPRDLPLADSTHTMASFLPVSTLCTLS